MDPPAHGAPVEPPRVHDPRGPSALAIRRRQTLNPVHVPGQTAQPVAAPQAQQNISEDVDDLYSPPEPAASQSSSDESEAVPGVRIHPRIQSPAFHARVQNEAPQLLDDWLTYREDVRYLVNGLKEVCEEKKEENRQLKKRSCKPLQRSIYVPKSPPPRAQNQSGNDKWEDAQSVRSAKGASLQSRPAHGSEWKDLSLDLQARLNSRQRRQNIQGMAGETGMPLQMPDSGSSSAFDSLPQASDFSYADPPRRSEITRFLGQGTAASKQPSSSTFRFTGEDQLLELQVKLRLLRANTLLSAYSRRAASADSTSVSLSTIKAAGEAVRSARDLVSARTGGMTPAGKAIMGLCQFYTGVCRLAESGVMSKERAAAKWFNSAAVNAEGVYPEALVAVGLVEALTGVAKPRSWSPSVASMIFSLAGPRTGTLDGSRPWTADSNRPKTASSGSAWSPAADPVPPSAGSFIGSVWRSMTKFTAQTGGEAGNSPPVAYSRDGNERSPGTDFQASSSRYAPSGYSLRDKMVQQGPGYGVRLVPSNSTSSGGGCHSPAEAPRYHLTNPDPSGDSSSSSAKISSAARAAPRRFDSGEPGESPLGTQAQEAVPPQKFILTNSDPKSSDSMKSSNGNNVAMQPMMHTFLDRPLVESPEAYHPQDPASPSNKRRSVAFSFPSLDRLPRISPGSTEGTTATSPQVSPTMAMAIRMGRRLSTIATGREKPDDLAMAEAGQSPYKSTFGPIDEGGMKRRKKSAEEMV